MKRKNLFILIIFALPVILFLTRCTKEGPEGPMGPTGEAGANGSSGTVTNYIFYGSGAVIGGTINFNSGVIGKNCNVKIMISAGYSIFDISSTPINFVRGTLASNIYYQVSIVCETPTGLYFYTKDTNLYAPSTGNVINIPVTEVYDYAGVTWDIPNTAFSIKEIKCDSANNIISFEYESSSGMSNAKVVRKYSSSGGLVNTLISNYDSSQYYSYRFNLDSSDNIYISYSYNGTGIVKKYSSAGAFISSNTLTNVNNPSDITIDSSGNIFVFNYDDKKIYKYDNGFAFLISFGGVGTGNGTFGQNGSCYIESDSADNIIVADTGNYLIQKFDNSGSFLNQFESHTFSSYFDVDGTGNIYVNGDSKYSNTGTLITKFSTYGNGIAVENSGANFYLIDSSKSIKKYNRL